MQVTKAETIKTQMNNNFQISLLDNIESYLKLEPLILHMK